MTCCVLLWKQRKKEKLRQKRVHENRANKSFEGKIMYFLGHTNKTQFAF